MAEDKAQKKKPGRPRGVEKVATSFRIPPDLLEEARRVTQFSPNTLSGLAEKGLRLAIDHELEEYSKKYGHEMPKPQ